MDTNTEDKNKENTIDEIKLIKGKIVLLSGLHIGGGDAQMKIGGIDNEVVKDINRKPFIPGSSLKGKMRNLLEWYLGFYDEESGRPSNHEMIAKMKETDPRVTFLQLFGSDKGNSGIVTRLSFWDCKIDETVQGKDESHFSETKAENAINRHTGTADNPRNMERVPVGNKFKFRLSLKIFSGDDETLMLELVKGGLKLLELDALGGSGSRGYGQIHFEDLKAGDTDWDLETDDCLTVLKEKIS